MTDSLLPQAPSLDEPLEMLEACHDRIEAQLQTLERLQRHLMEYGNDLPAQQAASGVLRYFELAGPNHHDDEEKDLFPALIRCADKDQAASVTRLTGDLLTDHKQMAAALDEVRRELIPVAEGHGKQMTQKAIDRLTSLYRQHIERENRELLPLARHLLTSAEIEELSRAMTKRRRPSP